MTADTTLSRRAEPEVDEVKRALFLSHLGRGHGMTISLRMADLSRETGRRLAEAWGWPDKAAVRRRYLAELAEVPTPRAPEPEPVEAEPDHPPVPGIDPGPDDHPAVERALSLCRVVRDKDHVAVARLVGSWSEVDLLETALILAALVPLGVEPETALLWLDRAPEEWPPQVLAVEAARWDAGARDATAEAAHHERARRGVPA